MPNHLYPRIYKVRDTAVSEMCQLEAEPFENVKNQIGFCGIWCGSCMGGNGAIQELAKRFETISKKLPQMEKWIPKDFDFKEFMKGLTYIQAVSSCPGCRKGGGPPLCGIRICALEKVMADCSQCDQLIGCKNFEQLEKDNPKMKEDLMEIKNKNRSELIEKWMSELKNKWPHCILVCASTRK